MAAKESTEVGQSPQLKVLAAMWSMRDYPSASKDLPESEKVRRIADEGFDGIADNLKDRNSATGLERFRMAADAGLVGLPVVTIKSSEDAQLWLPLCREAGATLVGVLLCDHDTSPADALAVTLRVMELGDDLGLIPHIEAHRDSCTETPEKVLALAGGYEQETGRVLKMNMDYSHTGVMKHVDPADLFEKLPGERMDLIQHSDFMDMRPFNSQHCQIAITNGHGELTPEFEAWLPFAARLFDIWLEAAAPRRTFAVTPEIGHTGGYYLSSFPDPWRDAIRARREIQTLWDRALERWPGR